MGITHILSFIRQFLEQEFEKLSDKKKCRRDRHWLRATWCATEFRRRGAHRQKPETPPRSGRHPTSIASTIFDCPEKRREKESAKSAGCADQTSKNANTLWEALRNKLKYCAIAHAEHTHCEEQKGHFKGQRRQRADGKEADRQSGEKS